MKCNFCKNELTHIFCDLGHQPPSNSFLTKEQLLEPETYYPLVAYVCQSCWLVQVPEVKKANEIFDDYVYFSSESPANISHAKEYVDMITERFHSKTVLEIGSNDGYMLQWFKEKGCEVLGVDPAEGPAKTANKQGIETLIAFFGEDFLLNYEFSPVRLSQNSPYKAGYDLICGINVLAHQPDINDFVAGLKIALAPEGVITFEFPHLMRLVEGLQFDTIYHEHYSYFSFETIFRIFSTHGLYIFDVDQIPEHGGSLRIYAAHANSNVSQYELGNYKIADLTHMEREMFSLSYYFNFSDRVEKLKKDFMEFLHNSKSLGEVIIAYGAAAKGNTFLNYCGIKPDLIPFVIDRSPHKQGKYLPGSHIPVVSEEIKNIQPDYILILSWNLKDEIMEQLSYIKEWCGEFVVAIPEIKVMGWNYDGQKYEGSL